MSPLRQLSVLVFLVMIGEIFIMFLVSTLQPSQTPKWVEYVVNGTLTSILVSSLLYLKTIKPLTKQKMLERELEIQRLQTLSSARLAAIGEMASGLAHEINTPLASITLLASQISRVISSGSVEAAQVDKFCQKIEKAVERIAKITYGLRTFSGGSGFNERRLQNVFEIIENTVVLINEKFKMAGISLTLLKANGEDLHIECIGAEIGQVLITYLNECYECIAGKEDGWVSIEVESFKTSLVIKILDNGARSEEILTKASNSNKLNQMVIDSHKGLLRSDLCVNQCRFAVEFPT